MTLPAALASTPVDAERAAELRRVKWLATGVLVATLIIFIAAKALLPLHPAFGFVAAFAALRCCRAGKRVSPLTDLADLPGSTATVLKAFAEGMGDTEQRLLRERSQHDKERRKHLAKRFLSK